MIVSQRPVLLHHAVELPARDGDAQDRPALAAGCTVVVKPPELTPLTTLAFVMLVEAGLPAGVVNVVTTTTSARCRPDHRRPAPAQALVHGSTPVGKKLIAQAAEASARVDGARRQRAVRRLRRRRPRQGGRRRDGREVPQHRAGLHRREPLHRARVVAEEFADRVTERVKAMKIGRGTEEACRSARSSTARPSRHRGARLGCRRARRDRARRRIGDRRPRTFFEPTVITEVAAAATSSA
jgi:succinate-semialdehyde dehydrogenase/glutarate-semialdehyde dehydrogenase